MIWQAFVLEHGRNVRSAWLARILDVSAETIERFRQKRPCNRSGLRTYSDLFAAWRGQPAAESDWPLPVRRKNGAYEWLQPELTLLASLVGTMSKKQLAGVLTSRLRRVTGDAIATRDLNSVQMAIGRLGLQASDVVGGITAKEAADRVGSLAVVQQAITSGHLRTYRVGRLHVIPHAEFDRWFATRERPPDGWIRLASLREPLGMSSDSKLPEYAALGYVPDVRRVQGIGSARGVWYIAPNRARQILEDAQAGRALPWHGKPLPGNQRMMWRKWQARKHRHCRRCRAIWQGPAPATFDAFCARYGSLTLGDKRHLTHDQRRRRTRSSRPWGTTRAHRRAGLTVADAARELHQPTKWIRNLIRRGLFEGTSGLLREPGGGEAARITVVGMAMLRGVSAGEVAARMDTAGWLGLHAAARHAGVCIATVIRWGQDRDVAVDRGPRGRLFERESLEARARRHWEGQRLKRAVPPAWLTKEHCQEDPAA